MTLAHALAILGIGLLGGAVNTIVGAASLFTFPVLLALGYPAVLANVTNTVGLGVPGSMSGAVGYRRELEGQRGRIVALAPAVVLGGATGAVLLLALPGDVFRDVVPVLILVAVVLVLVQPRVAGRRLALGQVRRHPGVALHAGTFLTAIYGGYFGAAQGVILLALLGMTLDDDLQRLNALKNVVGGAINGVAAVLFVCVTDIAWIAALLLAAGSIVGGQLGAHIARRISRPALRIVIAIVGTAVAVKLFLA